MERVQRQGIKCIGRRAFLLFPLHHFRRTQIVRRIYIATLPVSFLLSFESPGSLFLLSLLLESLPHGQFHHRFALASLCRHSVVLDGVYVTTSLCRDTPIEFHIPANRLYNELVELLELHRRWPACSRVRLLGVWRTKEHIELVLEAIVCSQMRPELGSGKQESRCGKFLSLNTSIQEEWQWRKKI